MYYKLQSYLAQIGGKVSQLFPVSMWEKEKQHIQMQGACKQCHLHLYIHHLLLTWILQDSFLSSWSMQWGVHSGGVVSRVPGGEERHLHCDPGRPHCLCHLAACPLLYQHSPPPPVEVWSSKTTVGLLRVVAAVDFHKKMEIMKMEEVSSNKLRDVCHWVFFAVPEHTAAVPYVG